MPGVRNQVSGGARCQDSAQWLQNPNFPIRAVFGPTDFKSAVLFFGSTYSENKKCSEIILYLILR